MVSEKCKCNKATYATNTRVRSTSITLTSSSGTGSPLISSSLRIHLLYKRVISSSEELALSTGFFALSVMISPLRVRITKRGIAATLFGIYEFS